MDGLKIFAAVAAFIVLAIGMSFGCAATVSEDRAVGAAENLGLTNVRVIDRGPAWGPLGGCHDDDVAKFTLRGETESGRERTIEVCAPVLGIGGYTVRN